MDEYSMGKVFQISIVPYVFNIDPFGLNNLLGSNSYETASHFAPIVSPQRF